MALDHMPARPCATASEPQATSGTRTAHTATRPSAIPAVVVTYARIGHLRLTRPRMTRARGWCCDLGYSPAEFSLSSYQPEDVTARCFPTFPELGTKRSPRRPGAELEEKDFSGNEKDRRWCRPLNSTLELNVSCWRPESICLGAGTAKARGPTGCYAPPARSGPAGSSVRSAHRLERSAPGPGLQRQEAL
jgi:hypothetical protein